MNSAKEEPVMIVLNMCGDRGACPNITLTLAERERSFISQPDPE